MRTLLIATLLLTAAPALADNDEFDGRRPEIVNAVYETGGPRTAGEKAGMIGLQAAGSTVLSLVCPFCGLGMVVVAMASQEDDPNPPPAYSRHFPPEGNE